MIRTSLIRSLAVVFSTAAFPLFVFAACPQSETIPSQPAGMPKATPQEVVPEKPKRTPAEEAMIRGDLMMIRRQYSDAIRSYNELLKHEPKNAYALNKIGIAYYALNDLDMARRFYERSIKANKDLPESHNNLGVVYYRRKKYTKAINSYQRSLALYAGTEYGKAGEERQQGIAAVYSNLGYAYFASKKYDEAMTSFQHALALDPLAFERRSSSGGSILQERTVEEHAFFLFFVAKSYALQKNAERTAHYLKRAYEEGYQNIPAIVKDPAFAAVIDDPQVREILNLAITTPATPPGKRTG